MRNYVFDAVVERVVDGDTIDLIIDLGFKTQIRERVRLEGIDCPETRTKDLKEKEQGLKAKAFVEDAIPDDGKVIYYSTTFKPGKFGRSIGSVMVPWADLDTPMPYDISLQQLLLEAGLAVKKEY